MSQVIEIFLLGEQGTILSYAVNTMTADDRVTQSMGISSYGINLILLKYSSPRIQHQKG